MGELARLRSLIAAKDLSAARRVVDQRLAEDTDATLDLLATIAATGDEIARELLLESLDSTRTAHKFIAGMLLDETAVDDVAQDTLISVATSIGTYSGRSKFTTWVHRIARNRAVDHLRRLRDAAPLPESGQEIELGPAARMSSMIATRLSVQQALGDLPELYRVPVSLRDLEGHTYAEIGERLGRSTGTVKSQVSRGRAMLAARVQGQG